MVVVVVDVDVPVAVAVADEDHSGHGHDHGVTTTFCGYRGITVPPAALTCAAHVCMLGTWRSWFRFGTDRKSVV